MSANKLSEYSTFVIDDVEDGENAELVAEISDKRDRILSASTSLSYQLVCIALLSSIWSMSNNSIFIVFSETIYDNIQVISVIAYVSFGFDSFTTMVLSSIGDYVGFDLFVVLLITLSIIGNLLSIIGLYNSNFIIICIGFFLYEQPLTRLINGYICSIVPIYYSKQLNGSLFESIQIGILIGPVLAGIMITFCGGYVGNFYFSLGLSILALLIYSISYMITICSHDHVHVHDDHDDHNHGDQDFKFQFKHFTSLQSIILNDQISTKQIKMKNKDYQFPVCIDNDDSKFASLKSDHDDDEKNLKKSDAYDKEEKEKEKEEEEPYEWSRYLLLFNFVSQTAIVSGIARAMTLYYVVYIKHKYENETNSNNIVLIATLERSYLIIWTILGMEMIKLIFRKFNDNMNIINNKNKMMFILFSEIINILITYFLYGNNNLTYDETLIYYWIYHLFYGFNCGLLEMILETYIIDYQPMKRVGFISGLKGFIFMIWAILIGLVITFLFDISVDYFWYVQSFFFTVGLCLQTAAMFQLNFTIM